MNLTTTTMEFPDKRTSAQRKHPAQPLPLSPQSPALTVVEIRCYQSSTPLISYPRAARTDQIHSLFLSNYAYFPRPCETSRTAIGLPDVSRRGYAKKPRPQKGHCESWGANSDRATGLAGVAKLLGLKRGRDGRGPGSLVQPRLWERREGQVIGVS